MKTILHLILSITFTCLLATAQAQRPMSITVTATFDYPGANSTTPISINDRGDVAGSFVDSNNATHGFVRHRNGTFSTPIIEPNDIGTSTHGEGINDSSVVCGYYRNADDQFNHGYFFSGRTFTQFDVANASSTFIFGINDGGDFVGSFNDMSSGNLHGYLNAGGTTTSFDVPGSSFTEPLGISNTGDVVGIYFSSDFHAFFRNAAGEVTFPLDVPGSTGTVFAGINESGHIVGNYTDGAGHTHALLMAKSGAFLSFDFPNATETSFNGINKAGMICGRFVDSSGVPRLHRSLEITERR